MINGLPQSERAYAKLTLFLHVLGRRAEDGYHLLNALVVFADAYDTLHAEPADELSLKLEGAFASTLHAVPPEHNVVLRAARLMQAHYGIKQGAAITLTKQLPVAAGIGGGSADAAAAMRLLNRLWGISAPLGELAPLAASLGADMTACLYSQPLRMQGIGEHIQLLPPDEVTALQGGSVLLVNAGVPLLTADVYRAMRAPSPAIEAPQALPNWRAARNDLQPAAAAICAEIAPLLEALAVQQGCEVARLCGSGATCFGWFDSHEAAQAALAELSSRYPAWWIKQASIL